VVSDVLGGSPAARVFPRIQLPYPSLPSASSVVAEHGCRRRARVSLSSAGVVVGESGGARESEC
jgi:hypothetical protein